MSYYSSQIAKTLADQVQNLAPLRDSFRKLEQYYMELTSDFNQLLAESEVSEKELLGNLRYLEEIHRSLEREFGGCTDDLRQLGCEKARMQMENKQLLSQSQALKGRQLLQREQKASLIEKREQLVDQNGKLTFSIGKFKELVHNIELAIKGKEYENLDIEKEIRKVQLVNKKISEINKESQESIDSLHLNNEEVAQQIYDLEEKLSTYDKLIDAKEKQNKDLLQTLIQKTEELEQIRHRKDYIDQLIQSETTQQRELIQTQGQLQSILAGKQEKLLFINQQNAEYSTMIQEEKEKQTINQEQLNKLQLYLQTLVSTNEELFRELEKSCSQDRDIQVMLSDKLERLLVINDQISQNDLQNRTEVVEARLFKEKNQQPTQKAFIQTHSNMMKKSMSPKASLIDKLNFTRTQQFTSTWGTKSKENMIAQ